MTDTDLITAGGSSDDVAAPETVASPPSETAPTADVASGDPAGSVASGGRSSGGRGASLTAMVLPDLRALANQLGVKGSSGMRKSELVAAIREHRGETNGGTAASAPQATQAAPAQPDAQTASETAQDGAADAPAQAAPPKRERRSSSRRTGAPERAAESDGAAAPAAEQKSGAKVEQAVQDAPADKPAVENDRADRSPKTEKTADKATEKTENAGSKGGDADQASPDADDADDSRRRRGNDNRNQNNRNQNNQNQNRGDQNRGDQSNRGDQNRDQNKNNASNDGGNNRNRQNDDDDDDGDGRGGRRGRRFRDRKRRERGGGGEGGGGNDRDTELREDDVVQPVAGILDVLDNYAFVRTSGYLAGPNDVYVSMNMVRKNGLRRGDAVTGAVRVPREGESTGNSSQNPRQKFNPLVRLDTVNGGPVENARNRPEFQKLTPLYPNQRLRLETTPDRLTTRVIDLIMPIGKGQRALIVSPPKAGKTTIMQDIANAITKNNPECHLMVVLVDERPEEVTDMQRSVVGEVIASTFDRPPSDHTQAAELAIERAKRLVEQGKDVVVLLDSITRLGRAYNNASPASGRILSGGVDSTALYPPKRFLGAARNIEFGGSLTIIATAMVETGSTGDTVIFEEFKGTGNAELKLDRKIAERRVFPAVDVNPSGTRKDELLLSTDEFGVVHKLRRVLSGLDSHQAIDLLMSQLRKTKTNYEFLVQVSKTTPGNMDND
ncbi:MAG: Transcription termination factor [Mycobacterium sp.]|nr:Transcription termination factor [Mycobacterium sp.]